MGRRFHCHVVFLFWGAVLQRVAFCLDLRERHTFISREHNNVTARHQCKTQRTHTWTSAASIRGVHYARHWPRNKHCRVALSHTPFSRCTRSSCQNTREPSNHRHLFVLAARRNAREQWAESSTKLLLLYIRAGARLVVFLGNRGSTPTATIQAGPIQDNDR